MFCPQKVLKTQKTRRSVSRAGGLPNLSILSLPPHARQKKSCRTSYKTCVVGAYSFCSPIFHRRFCHIYGVFLRCGDLWAGSSNPLISLNASGFLIFSAFSWRIIFLLYHLHLPDALPSVWGLDWVKEEQLPSSLFLFHPHFPSAQGYGLVTCACFF